MARRLGWLAQACLQMFKAVSFEGGYHYLYHCIYIYIYIYINDDEDMYIYIYMYTGNRSNNRFNRSNNATQNLRRWCTFGSCHG